ncbi:ankyrin [Zopfia rhizophila CBS 207.26]|uniref:Ankyrin n=1 Tax=Zopfia rhizophila CBS 207.26 TaxID=1314779 RepID=A0A6A6DCA2_9PEZI|nr:ankyrin [Zopfia rhizophila CBS 207.26]
MGILRSLLEQHAANVDLVDDQRRNALHFAARSGYAELFDILASKGLDCNSLDGKGDTVLYYAASSGSCKIVKRLLESCLTVSGNLWSPLHWAYRAANWDAIDLLKDIYSSEDTVETVEPPGLWTPLSIGVFHHNKQLNVSLEKVPTELSALLGSSNIAIDPGLRLVSIGDSKDATTYVEAERHGSFYCDGCLHDIYRPRFHCLVCEDLDFCFMCKPTANKVHPDHAWKIFTWEGGRSVEMDNVVELESAT